MLDGALDEAALTTFRQRADEIVFDGRRSLAAALARASELSQQAVSARAESEEQKAALLKGRAAAESARSD